MKTITLDQAKKQLEELMEVVNAGPTDINDNIWGEIDWLNEVISMCEIKDNYE